MRDFLLFKAPVSELLIPEGPLFNRPMTAAECATVRSAIHQLSWMGSNER